MTYDWDSLKSTLYDLYVRKNLTLDQVRKEIEARYRIVIKNRTYRQKFQEWKFRKSDHKERRYRNSRCRPRPGSPGSSPGVGPRNAPRKNSPVLSTTNSTNPQSQVGRGPLIFPAGTIRKTSNARIANRPMSSSVQFPIYEDTEMIRRKSENNFLSPTETRTDAMLPDGDMSAEIGSTPMDLKPLGELRSPQLNMRDYITKPDSVENPATQYVLPARPAGYQDGSYTNFKSTPDLPTQPFESLPTCDSCDLRLNNAGVSWEQCTQYGCLYFGLSFDPRVPSLNLFPVHDMQSAPDLANLAWNVPPFPLQDAQLGYAYNSAPNHTERIETVDPALNYSQSQRPVSFLQDPSPYRTDPSSVNFFGDHMNINVFTGQPLPPNISNHSLHLRSDSIAHGGYYGTTEGMNTATPQVFPNLNLMHNDSAAPAATMFTLQNESYELPLQSNFELQAPTMLGGDFDILFLQQEDALADKATGVAIKDEGQGQI